MGSPTAAHHRTGRTSMWITGAYECQVLRGRVGGVQTVIPQRLAVPSEGVSLQKEPSGWSFLTWQAAEPQLHLQTVTTEN